MRHNAPVFCTVRVRTIRVRGVVDDNGAQAFGQVVSVNSVRGKIVPVTVDVNNRLLGPLPTACEMVRAYAF